MIHHEVGYLLKWAQIMCSLKPPVYACTPAPIRLLYRAYTLNWTLTPELALEQIFRGGTRLIARGHQMTGNSVERVQSFGGLFPGRNL